MDDHNQALEDWFREHPGSYGPVLDQMAKLLTNSRKAHYVARRDLQAAAIALIPEYESEAGFARRTGIDRMTVRRWLGKR